MGRAKERPYRGLSVTIVARAACEARAARRRGQAFPGGSRREPSWRRPRSSCPRARLRGPSSCATPGVRGTFDEPSRRSPTGLVQQPHQYAGLEQKRPQVGGWSRPPLVSEPPPDRMPLQPWMPTAMARISVRPRKVLPPRGTSASSGRGRRCNDGVRAEGVLRGLLRRPCQRDGLEAVHPGVSLRCGYHLVGGGAKCEVS
jgi:hypothetical protein